MSFDRADVFIPTPSWVSYLPQAILAGHNVIRLNTNYEERWRVTADIINKAATTKQCQPSVMILNYPGNPDGLTYTEDELKEIAEAARAHNIIVISDEIYGLLDFNNTHRSFANYYPEGTITTTGLSKWCGAGGWRLGVAMLSDHLAPKLKQTFLGIASETYSCAPSPVQMAAKVAYGSYAEMKAYLTYQTAVLQQIGWFCAGQLKLSGVQVHEPQGGFYLFPDFTRYKEKLQSIGIYTSEDLSKRLIKDIGVALLPASSFGHEETHLALRLAYVDFEEPGTNVVFNVLKDCPKVTKGIRLMHEWITNLK